MARVVRRTYLGGTAAVVGGLLAAACGEVEIRYVQGPAGPAGPAGAQGERGAAGAAGAKGAAGAAGQTIVVEKEKPVVVEKVVEKVVTVEVEKPVVVEKVVEKVVERASSRLVAWTGPTIGSVGRGADLWNKLDALFADMHPEIQLTRSRPARPEGKSNDDVLIAAAAAGIAPDVYSVNVTAWQQARLVELGLPLALDRYYASEAQSQPDLPLDEGTGALQRKALRRAARDGVHRLLVQHEGVREAWVGDSLDVGRPHGSRADAPERRGHADCGASALELRAPL